MRALTEDNLTVDIEWRDGNSYLEIRKNNQLFIRQVEFGTFSHKLWTRRGCDAVDRLTGLKVSSKGWKSYNGSLKHASEDLTRLLINRGII